MAWTSPRTWVAAETVTATIMNTHVRDNLKAIGDAWTTYVPTIGAWTLGNGTVTGRSVQAGKLIIGSVQFTFGSTSAASGSLTFSLPATARASTSGMGVGTAGLNDSSASSRFFRTVWLSSTTAVGMMDAGGSAVNATVPFTWATGDTAFLSFCYEAA